MKRHMLVPPIKIPEDVQEVEQTEQEPEPQEPPRVVVSKSFQGEIPGQQNDQDRRSGDRRSGQDTGYSGPERRRHERRSMDRLRNEFEWKQTPEPKPELLEKVGIAGKPFKHVKPQRLILLVIAIGAGSIAAFLSINNNRSSTLETATILTPAIKPAPEVVQVELPKILVAERDIAPGEALSADLLVWQSWPTEAMRDDFIIETDQPEASTSFGTMMSKNGFFAGEPIRTQKLIDADAGSMSSRLASGKRGVSVTVDSAAATGGFILPNDRVDLVATLHSPQGPRTETILHNVRVLALNSTVGSVADGNVSDLDDPLRDELLAAPIVATLELDAAEAELIVNAQSADSFALVLRALADAPDQRNVDRSGINQRIRLTSPFWNSTDQSSQLR